MTDPREELRERAIDAISETKMAGEGLTAAGKRRVCEVLADAVLDALGDVLAENERLRGERDLFAEYVRDPAHLLRLLLDARGVEPQEWVGPDGLPTAIRIPPYLSRRVFGMGGDHA